MAARDASSDGRKPSRARNATSRQSNKSDRDGGGDTGTPAPADVSQRPEDAAKEIRALRKALAEAHSRIAELEARNIQAINHIDWVRDSLQTLLDDDPERDKP
ncbi:MAG: hypothetical protein AAFR04_04975 [Pseudomonadota bacterium]